MQSQEKELRSAANPTPTRAEKVRDELLAIAARIVDDAPRADLAGLERLRVRAEAALGTCRTAAAQVQAVLDDVTALQAAAGVPERSGRMRQVELDEAIAAASQPKLPPKPKDPVDLKGGLARLQRLDPGFEQRVVGKAKVSPSREPARHRSPERDAQRRQAHQKYEQRQRERLRNPKQDAFENALDRAKLEAKTTRAGHRLTLNVLRRLHGEELARFIAHDILCDVPNTTAICLLVGRLMGTFPSRLEAEEACAQYYGDKAVAELRAGKDVLARYAKGLTLEHEDGRCSWFRC